MNEQPDKNPDHNLLGQILKQRGLINDRQLQEALDEQKKHSGLIGEILVTLGYVQEIDVVVALILQCELPYIAVSKYSVNESILSLVPEEVARKHHVIPLDLVGEVLSVVMTDPLNKTIIKKLETLTNCRVAAFISTKSEIERAIAESYGKTKK